MRIDWRAVVLGFVVTVALGVASGLIVAGADATTPAISWGLVGALGGIAAGFVAGGTVRSGAVHGGLATVFGWLVLLAVVTVTGLLFAGIVPALGVLGLGLLMLALYAIPGAVGGAVGSWIKGRRTAAETARPQI
ncbi:DUF5518 domain-containing protein [Natronorarus salvus]|uniref:DUF5518 domain-containing protein n=1 Tax=Natronorarus salvus TaxID=3117733 RepID=UPI002F26D351